MGALSFSSERAPRRESAFCRGAGDKLGSTPFVFFLRSARAARESAFAAAPN
jgi:hypothetical protein